MSAYNDRGQPEKRSINAKTFGETLDASLNKKEVSNTRSEWLAGMCSLRMNREAHMSLLAFRNTRMYKTAVTRNEEKATRKSGPPH
jgi:hypothetical protein